MNGCVKQPYSTAASNAVSIRLNAAYMDIPGDESINRVYLHTILKTVPALGLRQLKNLCAPSSRALTLS